ncbi:hypothetical protein QTH90_16165 [Variovorax sp. J2P1-59]|uniref:hypothetical protein n=1 Tax=Variovorax flavidus TaxID=3053501 RepID=UPI0025779E73|nr:hypothetical protein [Variovorax sp. J2P1-59]MDM0075940.1 hypothetical protein [Variovorax sp. J2P1-59]
MNLRSVLLVRGALGVLFGLYVMIAPPVAQLGQQLGRNGYFSIVDGLIALALAFVLTRYAPGKWLFALVLADALMRLVIGVVAFAYPNIEARIVGAVAFFGTLITVCIALGVVGLIYVMMNRGASPEGPREGHMPAAIASACTLAFGIALMFGFSTADGRRTLIGIFALATGLTYLVTGLRLKRP